MESKLYNLEVEFICNTERNNLQISWDDEDGFVLLFTPDMGDTGNHYHVELSEDEATRLSSFLNKKLGELRLKIVKVLGSGLETE